MLAGSKALQCVGQSSASSSSVSEAHRTEPQTAEQGPQRIPSGMTGQRQQQGGQRPQTNPSQGRYQPQSLQQRMRASTGSLPQGVLLPSVLAATHTARLCVAESKLQVTCASTSTMHGAVQCCLPKFLAVAVLHTALQHPGSQLQSGCMRSAASERAVLQAPQARG